MADQYQGGIGGGQRGMSEQGLSGQGMRRALDQDGCVLTCTVTDCGFNKAEECWAQQIQVGDQHPTCDTFTRSTQVQQSQQEGIVMACRVSECNFNDSQNCHARGITVSTHTEHADCLTFRPKM